MRGTSRLLAAALVVIGGGVTTANAAPPETYPLAKVTRGQTGYGMTTFAGNTPEKFTFEVVSVVRNFLPKQDIILVKSADPKLAVTGFWQGMSGSPLYIDDKLVCAFSYGFRFNKVALGGCTPIDYMKKDGEIARRAAVTTAKGAAPNAPKTVVPTAATLDDWRRLTPKVDVNDAFAALGPSRKNWLLSAPLPRAAPKPSAVDGEVMTASVPLSVAGFSAPAYAQLAKMFDGSDVVPVRAGGSAGRNGGENGPKQFVMGGSISVELIRGDMAAAATGTVSHIDGNKILAFGHPMFQSGETYAPVSTATVHTVIASAQSAFVMATPMNEIGSLVQDRQSAIVADLGLRTPTVPMNIAITTSSPTGPTQNGTFNVELLDSKFLTPALAGAALANAVQYYLPDREDVTAKVMSSVRVKGYAPIEFVDYMHANDGAMSVMGSVRGLRALVPLLLNPYQPVTVEGIDIRVDLRFEANFGELKEIRIPTTDLVPGQRNIVQARLSTWDGNDVWEDVPVDVPAALAGSIVNLEITSGDSVKIDAAPPVDLPTLMTALRKFLPGNVWAATLYPAEDGVALDGKLVRDLPPSAQDKLHPQTRIQRVVAYKPLVRTTSITKRVIDGGATTLVRIRALK